MEACPLCRYSVLSTVVHTSELGIDGSRVHRALCKAKQLYTECPLLEYDVIETVSLRYAGVFMPKSANSKLFLSALQSGI